MAKDATPTEPHRKAASDLRTPRIDAAEGRLASPCGLGRRTVAFLIDLFLMSIGAIVLSQFGFAIAFRLAPGNDTENGGLFTFLVAALVLVVVIMALPVVYGWMSTASHLQGTPGKWIMKIAVVRATTGEPPNGWYAALRSSMLWLLLLSGFILAGLFGISIAILLVPFMPVILVVAAYSDTNRRSLHDLFADTRVIRDPRHAPAQTPGADPAPR